MRITVKCVSHWQDVTRIKARVNGQTLIAEIDTVPGDTAPHAVHDVMFS